MSRYPVYDPDRDGNVFEFILRASYHVREQRTAPIRRGLFTPAEMELIRKLDRDLDGEENEHFVKLRAAQKARKATGEVSPRKSR